MKHLLYFTAEWCNPCKRTRPIVEELERDGVINVTYVDVDDNIDLAKTYQILAIPTFILIENNEEVKRMNGAKTKEQFEEFLNG